MYKHLPADVVEILSTEPASGMELPATHSFPRASLANVEVVLFVIPISSSPLGIWFSLIGLEVDFVP